MLRTGRGRWAATAAVALALLAIGAALGQDREPAPRADQPGAGENPGPARKGARRGGLRVPFGPARPGRRQRGARGGADLLNPPVANAKAGAGAGAGAGKVRGKDARKALLPEWPYHYRLRIEADERTRLAATYYPAKNGGDVPVVLLIHDRGPGRSGKDFQEPIGELKGEGLAESLQEDGYAVLVPDLRGHGENLPRRERDLSAREWAAMTNDLQALYRFLVDRHNRQELNLAKLGVLALGEGATLAAAWAASPGAAVSSEGRISDLAGMVLVSPTPTAPPDDPQALRLAPALVSIAPRIPLLVLAGDRDADTAKAAQSVIERHRQSRVAFYDTKLRTEQLLRFVPKVPDTITRFLEETVKFRDNAPWEPRYLLDPVAHSDVEVVAGNPPAAQKKAEPARAKAKADAKAAPAREEDGP